MTDRFATWWDNYCHEKELSQSIRMDGYQKIQERLKINPDTPVKVVPKFHILHTPKGVVCFRYNAEKNILEVFERG